MNQVLIVEFSAKDEASVMTLRHILQERRSAMKEAGCKKIDWYTNQDDPKSLVYIAEWPSRGQYDDYMKWAQEQSNNGTVSACFARPPRLSWLRKTEA